MRLTGPRVTLRRFAEGEFDVVWDQEVRAHEERSGGGGPSFHPKFHERFQARVAASGSWGATELLLAVEADGSLAGVIQARRSEDVLPPGVFELGIQIFLDRRGRGVGTEALWLITDHLIRDEGAVRVQLGTDVENAAMRRAAEAAGYSFEGVMRSFWQVPGEAPRDHALYAMTAADHAGAKPPWTRAT